MIKLEMKLEQSKCKHVKVSSTQRPQLVCVRHKILRKYKTYTKENVHSLVEDQRPEMTSPPHVNTPSPCFVMLKNLLRKLNRIVHM